VWEKIEAKLVYGENIAQAAQFVQTGNAQVGIIALSLALSPELAKRGSYALIQRSCINRWCRFHHYQARRCQPAGACI